MLKGIRSEDGFEVTVTHWRMPEQERTGGHVDLGKDVLEPDDVCVVHSHHTMGARFSGIDTASLNPRYPASVVIAQSNKAFLGFDYQGTGKVILPCGAKGEVPFGIQCTVGPETAKVNRVVHNAHDLGDCFKVTNAAEEPYTVLWSSACGLQEQGKPRPMPAAFGVADDLFQEVAKLPRERDRRQRGVQQWDNKNFQNNNNCQMGFGNYTLTREVIDGYVCNKCQGELCWSIAQKGDGYCFTCNEYYTIPKEEKQSAKKPKDEAKDVPLSDDTEWCQECMSNYDWDSDWHCPGCNAPYCMDCHVYHEGDCVVAVYGM